MTALPLDLTGRCPTRCQDHIVADEESGIVQHEAIVGVAGPLEVALQCFVLPGQPDPVTELTLYDVEGRTSGERTMTLPLDARVIHDLVDALRRAVATSGLSVTE